mmetsp:Transcript_101023/g.286267  ORF Transcript_101023/g.286267 Transcript_101023/m.286267 type:complete len:281 (+) Transcript_101023:24-866(+)
MLLSATDHALRWTRRKPGRSQLPQIASKFARISPAMASSPKSSCACDVDRQQVPARRPSPGGSPVTRAQWRSQKSQKPARRWPPAGFGSVPLSSKTVTSPTLTRSQRSTSAQPPSSRASVSMHTSSPSSPPPASSETRHLRGPPTGGAKLSEACLSVTIWPASSLTCNTPQLLPCPKTSPGVRTATSTKMPLGAWIRTGPSPRMYFSTRVPGGRSRVVSLQTPQNFSMSGGWSPSASGGLASREGGPSAWPASINDEATSSNSVASTRSSSSLEPARGHA